MLKTISFINLIISVAYFLAYLQNGNYWVIAGLLAVVIFNWMTIRNLETNQINWTLLQWALALFAVLFGLFITYSSIILLFDAIKHNYYTRNNVLLIVSDLIFAAIILFQFFMSWTELQIKKSE